MFGYQRTNQKAIAPSAPSTNRRESRAVATYAATGVSARTTTRAIGSTGMFVSSIPAASLSSVDARTNAIDVPAAISAAVGEPPAEPESRAARRPAAAASPSSSTVRSSRSRSSTPTPMTTAIATARGVTVTSGISVGQACELSALISVTRTRAHSGRWNRYIVNGSEDGGARREAREQPDATRRPVPQLREEVREREEQERQRRVVVVLERRAVDARPGDPLAPRRRWRRARARGCDA